MMAAANFVAINTTAKTGSHLIWHDATKIVAGLLFKISNKSYLKSRILNIIKLHF